MVEMTTILLEALDQEKEPLRLLDPRTRKEYVMVPKDQFDQLVALAHEKVAVQEAYPLMDEVARREGWDDPEMDIYNDFTPQR